MFLIICCTVPLDTPNFDAISRWVGGFTIAIMFFTFRITSGVATKVCLLNLGIGFPAFAH